MTESRADRSFILASIILLPLLLSALVSQAQFMMDNIGNQEALSLAHGVANNSISISESSKGGPMRTASPPVQRDVGWIVGNFADGYGVILHTTNGGENWTRQGSPNTIPKVLLQDVRAIDARSAWAVGGNDDHYGVILRTTDGGRNWIRCGSPGSVPDFGPVGVGALDSKHAWVVGSNGTIIHTEDGGKTWVQQASNTKATLMKVAVVDRHNTWIVGDKDNGYAVILRTSDGGLTWTRQGNASTIKTAGLIDVTAVDNRTAWTVGEGYAILKTIDGGASWQSQLGDGTGLAHINGACAIDARNAWVTQDFGIVYWTSDGGKTWNEQSPGHGYYLMSASARTLKTVWVVGQIYVHGGIILHTTDGGINWTEQSAPVNVEFYRVSFVGTRS